MQKRFCIWNTYLFLFGFFWNSCWLCNTTYCSLASLDEESGLHFEYEEHTSGNSVGEKYQTGLCSLWLAACFRKTHCALYTLWCIQALQDGAWWMPSLWKTCYFPWLVTWSSEPWSLWSQSQATQWPLKEAKPAGVPVEWRLWLKWYVVFHSSRTSECTAREQELMMAMLVNTASTQSPTCPWMVAGSSWSWPTSGEFCNCSSITNMVQLLCEPLSRSPCRSAHNIPLWGMWESWGDTTQPQVRVTAVTADSKDEDSAGGFDTSA